MQFLISNFKIRISKTPIWLALHALDNRFGYPLLFTNHRDTESTEGTIFFARSGEGDRAKVLSPAGTIL